MSFLALLGISFICLTFSCKQKSPEWKGTIEESDGVVIIKNPKKPIYGEEVFSIEEDLSIGVAEGPEEYMFSKIDSIAVDEQERIYVLDSREKHIKVFDSTGVYVTTVGRKGQGPGELAGPRNLCITNQNQIMVPDATNLRITFFSLEGEYSNDIGTPPRRLLEAKVDSRGNIIGVEIVIDEENPRHELRMFDSDLNVLQSFCSSPLPDMNNLNPFMPMLTWDIYNYDRIICGWPDSYEIEIYDTAGNLTRKIIREYDPLEITEEDKEKFKDIPPELKVSFRKYHAPYWKLTVSDEGRIYAMTWERVGEGEYWLYYDVFDAEGKYIAKIPLFMNTQVVKKNRLYTIESDDDGYYVVKRYKVTWNY